MNKQAHGILTSTHTHLKCCACYKRNGRSREDINVLQWYESCMVLWHEGVLCSCAVLSNGVDVEVDQVPGLELPTKEWNAQKPLNLAEQPTQIGA
eukprot:1152023-Pelagomonas_calceolata.AAC.3